MEAAKLTQGGQTLQNAHCDDQWAFLQFPNPLAGLLDYEQARNKLLRWPLALRRLGA
jgi:hypothetical protein